VYIKMFDINYVHPKSLKVCVISSMFEIREVIPAKDRHKKNNMDRTLPNPPIESNSTGIL